MKKLDNFIFYSICEVTIEIYLTITWASFEHFCDNMALRIRLNNLNSREKIWLNAIYVRLRKMYNLKDKEASDYIAAFFLERQFKKYEESVLEMFTYYPESFRY